MRMDSRRFSLDRHLPSIFDINFRINKTAKPRKHLFTTKSFFLAMLGLVCSADQTSYWSSLIETFTTKNDKSFLTASALCQLRKKIDFRFFKSAFEKLRDHVFETQSYLWNDLNIIAIDGMGLTLPRSKEITDHGYNGRAVSHFKESYLPRAYMVMAYDVLRGIVCEATLNKTLNEISDAKNIVPRFSAKSLFLYDRLYFCRRLVLTHKDHGSFFVMRVKSNACKEIKSFFSQKKTFMRFTYYGVKICLVKVKNKDGTTSVYATNLAQESFSKEDIVELYRLRWRIETAFKDFSTSLGLENWHSKTENGIYQELYLRFWIFNLSRYLCGACQSLPDLHQSTYKLGNLRQVMRYIRANLHKKWKDIHKLISRVKEIITRTTQTRTVNKRLYERIVKSPGSPYRRASTTWITEGKVSLA